MSKAVTALLVDDERKSLATLRSKIERFCPEINIIGETQNPVEAIGLIDDLNPQLLFLDVAMPQLSGFDLLAKIANPDFEIIFATAFDQYAVEAIKHCAIGYLVKPIDKDDLMIAVKKAIQNINQKESLAKNKQLVENLKVRSFQKKKLVIPTQDGLEFVMIEDITRCEGVDGYTKIYFSNRKALLSSRSIGHFKGLLINYDFYLVHKSYLISLNHIERYLLEGTVVLTNNQSVTVSRSRRTDFLNVLKER